MKRDLKYLLMIVLMLLFLCVVSVMNACGATFNGNKNVNKNTTITDEWIVNGDLSINSNITLTVSEGAFLYVFGNVTLGAEAMLNVSEGSKVVIEGNCEFGGRSALGLGLIPHMAGIEGEDAIIIIKGDVSSWRNKDIDNDADDGIKIYVFGDGGDVIDGGKTYDDYVEDKKTDPNLQEVSALMPIELTYFTAQQEGDEIVFEWETASEVENDGFEVMCSYFGFEFFEISKKIKGAGTSSVSHSYTFRWKPKESGLYYFVLRQTDFNGDEMLSDVIVVDFEKKIGDGIYYQNGKIMHKGNQIRF